MKIFGRLTGLVQPINCPLDQAILIGLALAVPLSALSGSRRVAKALRRCRLLMIPEEMTLPPLMASRDQFERRLRAEIGSITLETLVYGELHGRAHFAVGLAPPSRPRGSPDLQRLSVAAKIADAEHPEEALAWFTREERVTLLSHVDLFESLIKLGRRTPAAPEVPGDRSIAGESSVRPLFEQLRRQSLERH